MKLIIAVLCLLTIPGCAWFRRPLPPPDPPLAVLVGPVTLQAPVSSPSDLYTFEDRLAPDVTSPLLLQLIDEVELTGQRLLTEALASQSGFAVIPFAETRRLLTNHSRIGSPLDPDELRALGQEAHADFVVTAKIVDYGVVRWQYWVPGLIVSMITETLIVGAASGFNPAIMAATAGSELLTDVPFWWGGAYVAGWAFRPVRVKAEAIELGACHDRTWTQEALVILVPGKTLEEYPADERSRKEVQLTVNLTEALKEIADDAGHELRRKPCHKPRSTEDGLSELNL